MASAPANSNRTSLPSGWRRTISSAVAKTTPSSEKQHRPGRVGDPIDHGTIRMNDPDPAIPPHGDFGSAMDGSKEPRRRRSSRADPVCCHASARTFATPEKIRSPLRHARPKIAGPGGASVSPVAEMIFESVLARHSCSEHAAERTPDMRRRTQQKLPATPCTGRRAPDESTIAPMAGTSIPDWAHAQTAAKTARIANDCRCFMVSR